MTTETITAITAIAKRVQDNLRRADLDASGNCFLAARAIQILANGGELVEGRLNDDHHVWYATEEDGRVTHWDITATGCGGVDQLAVTELPDSYTSMGGWEWPEIYSTEFAADLVELVRPNY